MKLREVRMLGLGLGVAVGACGGLTRDRATPNEPDATSSTQSTTTGGPQSSTASAVSSAAVSSSSGVGGSGGRPTLNGTTDSAGGSGFGGGFGGGDASGGGNGEPGGAGGEAGAGAGCSDFMLERFASLREPAFAAVLATQRMIEVLAQACHEIASDQGQDPEPLATPPTAADVQASCQSASAAIDAAVLGLASAPSIGQESCSCADDEMAGDSCLESCATLDSGDGFCPSYCFAVGWTRPSCERCVVTVEVDDAALAATLEANLPAIYTTEARSYYFSWGVDTLSEAALELGTQLDEDCAAELQAPIADALEAMSENLSDIEVVEREADGVLAAAQGS